MYAALTSYESLGTFIPGLAENRCLERHEDGCTLLQVGQVTAVRAGWAPGYGSAVPPLAVCNLVPHALAAAAHTAGGHAFAGFEAVQ